VKWSFNKVKFYDARHPEIGGQKVTAVTSNTLKVCKKILFQKIHNRTLHFKAFLLTAIVAAPRYKPLKIMGMYVHNFLKMLHLKIHLF